MKNSDFFQWFPYVLASAMIILLAGAFCGLSSIFCSDEDLAATEAQGTMLLDDFQSGTLSVARWSTTFKNDFKEKVVDIFDVGKRGKNDLRLRLVANTLGTNDETVKSLGVRSVREIDFVEPKTISFVLDWNDQANGSYLTASAYICPTLTDATPADESDWIKFEYVGVPPGHNARFQIVRRTKGSLRVLFDEGWPDKQRTGRKIEEVTAKIVIDRSALKMFENGIEIFSTPDHSLDLSKAYLYLQMNTHSNYPSRAVYFDNVIVTSVVD